MPEEAFSVLRDVTQIHSPKLIMELITTQTVAVVFDLNLERVADDPDLLRRYQVISFALRNINYIAVGKIAGIPDRPWVVSNFMHY